MSDKKLLAEAKKLGVNVKKRVRENGIFQSDSSYSLRELIEKFQKFLKDNDVEDATLHIYVDKEYGYYGDSDSFTLESEIYADAIPKTNAELEDEIQKALLKKQKFEKQQERARKKKEDQKRLKEEKEKQLLVELKKKYEENNDV